MYECRLEGYRLEKEYKINATDEHEHWALNLQHLDSTNMDKITSTVYIIYSISGETYSYTSVTVRSHVNSEPS